ncbi:MAG: nitroreductase family deazaflavin-dependent oxidoreductase [Acidimicrobiia bacterium]|nr:nitroreductase family deazaflavin-dependent oxidoreductase [Acidimicrobiia bacterium]
MDLTTAREGQLRSFFRWVNRRMLLMWRLGFGSHFADPTVGYIMVLTTTGRKSGQPRRAPLNFALEGNTVQCLAGFGATTHWLLNLQADPRCEVWLPDGRRVSGHGEMVTDEERRIALVRQVLIRSGFAAKLAHPGLDLTAASDEQIASLGVQADRRYEVVEIELGEAVTGPGGPGDLEWVAPTVVLVGLAALLSALLLRKRTR